MNVMNVNFFTRNTSPKWLDGFGAGEQHQYSELERECFNSQAELDRQLENFVSLRTYARSLMSHALQQDFGYSADPDLITAHDRYVFQAAGRTFIQEDRRSLVDLLLHGLHEPGMRGKMTFSGNEMPSNLNQPWLEEVFTGNVRASFAANLRKAYERKGVLAAMNNLIRYQLLLSAFAAKCQGHLSDHNWQRIQRAIDGDPTLIVAPLLLQPDARALKDLVAVGSRGENQESWLLYAPGSPDGRDWYEKPTLRVLSLEIGAWTSSARGRDYLAWQSHALDRERITAYLKQASQRADAWVSVALAPTPFQGDEVLVPLVNNERAWRVSQEESQTPYGYRTADEELRQRFTRINVELKALQTVHVRKGGFASYEIFCRDLIKTRVEEVLQQRGHKVVIIPELIEVQIDERQRMTLHELIVGEVTFYAEQTGQPLYPRFVLLEGHPPFTGLDIRDIASWSRTLRPGEQYIDRLRSVDLNAAHPEGLFKRGLALAILQRRMQVAIMQAKFNGQLPQADFAALLGVVNLYAENNSGQINKNADAFGNVDHSVLHQLFLLMRPVEGVYVFRLNLEGRAAEYLFTPDAPDGRELRPFSEFVSAVKTRGLGDYLFARLYVKHQPQVGAYLRDLQELSRATTAPTLNGRTHVTDFNDCYRSLLYKVISDVDEKTRSLKEIINGLFFDAAVAAAGAISIVFAPVGIALSAVLFTKAMVQGFEANGLGDRAKALSHLKDALIELASLGKAGFAKSSVTQVQKNLIGLLGDTYLIEKLVAEASGQPRLHGRALEVIQEILDDPQSTSSKTTLV
ncbi:dermonecrotic toxin domain-containing protein [Pseudomonas sp. NPDC087803]|uniref:dermonecrotic toxin domain-containing protein n=1 Tax=Pseudomonas sp. NPDC087803 TaxID=3364448 RepID=UPI0037F67E61